MRSEVIGREAVILWLCCYQFILASKCLSGGSDGTVRLWSLGQQRCITTYRIHGEGVWALCANDNFTGFYSSGRDKNVMWTDLSLDNSSTLLFVEDAPVLKVSIVKDRSNTKRNINSSTL